MSTIDVMLEFERGPASETNPQAAAFGAVVADWLIWHCALALVFSANQAQRAYQRAKRWVDRITGIVMTAFVTRLALN